MTGNLKEERRVEAIEAKKAESRRIKRVYREGVEHRKEEREAKRQKNWPRNRLGRQNWPLCYLKPLEIDLLHNKSILFH